jgi:putative ABC transport system permease protein
VLAAGASRKQRGSHGGLEKRMSNLFPELRYALRMLAKQPGFAFIAIFTLALGIGANTAIFSVVNALLLRPLPYPDPDRLVRIRERTPVFDSSSVSYPNYLDWRAGQRTFTDVALYRRGEWNLSNPGSGAEAERVGAGRISYNFFSVLGVFPELGRDLREADDVPNASRVVLISDALWKRRFGGAPNVIGQQITLDSVPHEIIGVMPPQVQIPRASEIFVPLANLRADENILSRGNHPGFSALGRLKPGVTLEQATANLNNIAAELERRYPDHNTNQRVDTSILLESAVKEYKQGVELLLAAVICVLLIACANVANLQLARALSRDRELAVRAALGASRAHLAMQVIVESGLLALFGAGAGILFSLWALDAIKAIAPADVPRFQETHLDLRVLFFTGAISMAAATLVALWPAWRVSRASALTLSLHEGGRGTSDGVDRQRVRSGLVIAQVALALLLLATAGLALKSFRNASNASLGFDPANIITAGLSISREHYDTDEKVAAFNRQFLDRLAALPGVEAAAIGSNIPFDDTEWDSSFHVTGTPPIPPGQEPSAEMNGISPDYFRVMGMPILRGRAFTANDRANQPRSVIIDESFARRYFPDKDPIGQQIDDNQSEKKDAPPVTIVGVVPRTRNNAPGEDNVERFNFPHMYYCADQLPSHGNNLLVRVRSGDPMILIPAIKRELRSLDPDQALSSISTMEQNIAKSLGTRRMMMSLLSAFAILALSLASIGLYGVMALVVTQRTRELGIRLALGANRGDVFRLVLGHGVLLVSAGLLIGLIAALGAGRGLRSLLYGVGGFDVPAFSIALFALAFVALVACFVPARRATRVDPIVALRAE